MTDKPQMPDDATNDNPEYKSSLPDNVIIAWSGGSLSTMQVFTELYDDTIIHREYSATDLVEKERALGDHKVYSRRKLEEDLEAAKQREAALMACIRDLAGGLRYYEIQDGGHEAFMCRQKHAAIIEEANKGE